MMQKGKLKIELCSDLCVGSGLAYAGIIDMDIVYDKHGFPYIPAKRLKGCLRDAAELFCPKEDVIRVFGHRGAGAAGCVRISNAVIKDAENLSNAIKDVKNDALLCSLTDANEILNLYTSIRAQTKINQETGSAEENSLRFTRVVNRFDPLAKNEMNALCFYADVMFEAENDAEAEWMERFLKRAAKAMRNIGMDRNRGLGSVRCSLEFQREMAETQKTANLVQVQDLGDGRVKITYMIENVLPLVLGSNDKSSTEASISGRSILGVLAGAYLRDRKRKDVKNAAETKEFRDLFLNGTVCYSSANLALEEQRTFPAPLYMGQLKKTKKLVNLLDERHDREAWLQKNPDYHLGNGNQPKKLKGKYLAIKRQKHNLAYGMTEPERELVFHHRHQHETDAPDALLYSIEVLSEGQKFIGEIYAKKEYQPILTELLMKAEWYFGKAKSAQYGKCRLVPFTTIAAEEPCRRFHAGDTIVVTLKNDAMFMKEDGNYTVQFDEVYELLSEELGISYESDTKEERSTAAVTEVNGYHTLWNMKRPAIPAVQSGSAFVYRLNSDLKQWPNFVGESVQEGYGEIDIELIDRMKYQAELWVLPQLTSKDMSNCEKKIPAELEPMLYRILKVRVLEQLLMYELDRQKRSNEKNVLNASNIGRITLMLKESLEAGKKKNLSPDCCAEDFMNRIQSIKSDGMRENAVHFACWTLRKTTSGEPFDGYEIDTQKMKNRMGNREILSVMQCLSENQEDQLLKEIWGDYMLQAAALMKYEKKGE